MKCKKTVIIFGVLFLLMIGGAVLAKDLSPESFDKALTYANFKDHLSLFTSKVWFTDDFWGLNAESNYLINSFVQGVFWIDKFIFSICSNLYELVKHTDGIDRYVKIVLQYASTIYKGLFGSYLPQIFLGFSAIYAYIQFIKGKSFHREIIKIVGVLLISQLAFQNVGGEIAFNKAYSEVSKASNTLVSEIASSFSKTATSELQVNVADKNSILDLYFQLAIWKPYAHMNAETGTNTEDSNGLMLSDKQLKGLLSYYSGNPNFKLNDVTIQELAGTLEEPNNRMLLNDWGTKFTYAIIGIVESCMLGFIILAFSIAEMVIKFLLLVIFLLLPFALIMALIPSFENVLINIFKKSLGFTVISSSMSLLTIICMYLYLVLSNVVEDVVKGDVILAAILKVVIIIFAIKNKDFIFSIFFSNRMGRLSTTTVKKFGNLGWNTTRKASQKAVGRMKQASTVAQQFGRGATIVAGRKASSAIGNKVRHFKPLADKDSKTNLYKEGVKDVGRKVKSVGHKTAGTFRNVRAEGVKNKSSLTYKTVKAKADKDMQVAKENAEKSLGFRQRKHNLETKQRLKLNREKRYSSQHSSSAPVLKRGREKIVVPKAVQPTVKGKEARFDKSIKPVKSIRPNRQDSIIVTGKETQSLSNPFIIKEDKKPKFRRK